MNQPASVETIQSVLQKVMNTGTLQRIPKHPDQRDVIMSLIALHLERRYPYTEVELKDVLTDALRPFNAKVDHVTCRRYLIDLGFMKRDRAGTRYFLNFPKLEASLVSDITVETVHNLLLELEKQIAQRELERAARRAQHLSKS
ncbi:MAG: DUF2087 domain-containing protein [Pseudomonadota bacterium]